MSDPMCFVFLIESQKLCKNMNELINFGTDSSWNVKRIV